MVGEPITATRDRQQLQSQAHVTYAWSGNGGQVTGKDTTAQIDNHQCGARHYTVNAHVTDARMRRRRSSCFGDLHHQAIAPKKSADHELHGQSFKRASRRKRNRKLQLHQS